MNVTVTLDATPALVSAITALANAITGKAADAPVEKPKAKSEKLSAVKDPAPEPEEAPKATAIADKPEPEEAKQEVSEESAVGISIEEIRKLATSSQDTRGAAKKLLGEFGVPNLTSLPKESYAAFYRKLKSAA